MSRTALERRWRLPAAPTLADLAALGAFSPLVAKILWQRGYHDPEAAAKLLDLAWDQRHDPFALRDMDRAVARIRSALEAAEPVAVYGDFDTDGVTAVALLMQLFAGLGLAARPYIPSREQEGYGLNTAAIDALHAAGVRLLVTVDCGISNAAEIAHAQALGLDVIVLDHHVPPPTLPAAVAVVNPKRADCPYPFKGLCGVGIAFKLFEALWQSDLRPAGLRARDILDVVALGTIADMMPLEDENRVLVHFGLVALNESRRPGVQALCEVARVSQGAVDAQAVSFRLAPRLNAAGRLEHALLSYDLLLATDPEQARTYAERLNETNSERQTLMRHTQDEARAIALAQGQDSEYLMVVSSPEFHAGVVGLAAGRLADEFCRPVLVLVEDGALCRGSARSIPGFNIVAALASCADLFERYGGHAAAAGMTLATANLPELTRRLRAYAREHITPEMLIPELRIDASVTLDELSLAALDELNLLAPFGQANPQPLLHARNLRLLDLRTVGDGSHLKLRLQQNRTILSAIGFGFGHLASSLERGAAVDVVFSAEINVWRDQRSPELRIVDIRPT